MKRQIIEIDEAKCTGCGICAIGCHEGALQIINSKAVLINDLLCDGLGACIGDCPEEAITITERETEPYNEDKVMEHLYKKSKDVIFAHFKHLKDHDETIWLEKGIKWLIDNKARVDFDIEEVISNLYKEIKNPIEFHGCPGSAHREVVPKMTSTNSVDDFSALAQWPVQLHLINPQSSIFKKSDLLVVADCVAFSVGNFHNKWLRGKKLIIACPKLDSNLDVYVEKVRSLIDDAKVNTINVMVMEVPCCNGLLHIVKSATDIALRKVPIKLVVVSIYGDILSEAWV